MARRSAPKLELACSTLEPVWSGMSWRGQNKSRKSRLRGSRGKPLSWSERLCAVQFEAVRQHDDGLGAALAFVHRKADRFRLVREQPAAPAFCVPDDPASETILSDVEARAGRRRCLNHRLLNHVILLTLARNPGPCRGREVDRLEPQSSRAATSAEGGHMVPIIVRRGAGLLSQHQVRGNPFAI